MIEVLRVSQRDAVRSALELREELQRAKIVGMKLYQEGQVTRAALHAAQQQNSASAKWLKARSDAAAAADDAIAALRGEVAAGNERIATIASDRVGLEAVITERDATIAALRGEIAAMASDRTRLETAVVDRDEAITAMNEQIAVRVVRPSLLSFLYRLFGEGGPPRLQSQSDSRI